MTVCVHELNVLWASGKLIQGTCIIGKRQLRQETIKFFDYK